MNQAQICRARPWPLPLAFLLVAAIAGALGGSSALRAQTAEPSSGILGTWEGTLGGALRLVLRITRAADGLLMGTLQSLDQGGVNIPIDRIDVSDRRLTFSIAAIGGSFDGRLTDDPPRLVGTWQQLGRSTPLTLQRASTENSGSGSAPPPGANSPGTANSVDPAAPPVALRTLSAPMPFTGSGRTHLAYEVNIVNRSAEAVLVSRLEVFDSARVLTSYEGAELNGIMIRPTPGADNREIQPKTGGIAFVWISLAPGQIAPSRLSHRVTVGERLFEGAAVEVAPRTPPIVGAPLTGSDWVAANGPGNTSSHRRAVAAAEGALHIAQRFAIDWVKLGEDKLTFAGDRQQNRNYHAYGAEALAVADGTVLGTKDGIPENTPGPTSRAVPITPETIAGNYVRLQLAGGTTALYAHLQPGSLRVKDGDRVTRGQVLGLVGNSGNSTEPHLHFHMGDGGSANWIAAEGIPYLIDAFDVAEKGGWRPHILELPMQNTVVRFRPR